ncbi:uncharacterized protein Z518_01286 [Rhinocladiella mackenziei CBS 650.93]|uniref:NADPH-dependent diflavin oxidoreductase 1 n=1 Tax=Rhinocladiella mackenziei CBS 650.93 TaxID=1442369 RepID=A0A0D2JL62_9EURO|nr:uncharacterized protein Z518_01286 [Rhinocladiella mackenziei CBS 650.93]KIX10205.1 hypothetical protein Z518_01286 [Rhinocladiella mackenziei CBS 650.93]
METNEQDRVRQRSVLVLYGTETGTSQDIAAEISRCLERIHFSTDVVGLDAVNHSHLRLYAFTVFVVSTTGQGDFPENARPFWTSLLRRKLSPTTLAGVDYAVVGLGDSSYLRFNWAARKLDKRLRQLGATCILEPCEADEQGDDGTDGAFLEWLQRFRETILTAFPIPEGQGPIADDVPLPSKWRLEQRCVQSDIHSVDRIHPSPTAALPSPGSFPVVLQTNQRVTPSDHWQDVRFMSLKTSRRIEYMPGDAIAISPQNMPTDVESLLARMNWHLVADTPIRLVSTRPPSNKNSAHFAANPIFSREDLTLRILLTEYLDINAIPRRSFFAAIARYTDDSMHKERLLEFTDPQYLDEYYDYATRPRRSILETLQEFDSVHLPWEEVTNIFPLLRPRQFSIASGGALKYAKDGSTIFELLVAIVKYRTVIKRIREGVCTRYLAQLRVGTTLQVSLKTEGRFSKLASDISHKHRVLIGAGTGIAPLRALIHEKASHNQPSGKTVLVFGCRSEKADYFFRDEWVGLNAALGQSADNRSDTSSLKVITAFSRDQNSKIYVQDRIREHSELIWDFLRERHAEVIICGSAGPMPKAVRQALIDALVSQGRKRATELSEARNKDKDADETNEDEDSPIETANSAEMYLARLEKEGKYKQETWS